MKLLPIFAHNLSLYSDAYKLHQRYNRSKLAELSCMSRAQYSQLCHGYVHHPSVCTADRLSRMMGVSIDDLVTGNKMIRDRVVELIETEQIKPMVWGKRRQKYD